MLQAPVSRGPQLLDPLYRVERVFIDGISMVRLVHDEESEGAELRDVSSEDPAVVHLSQGVVDPFAPHEVHKGFGGPMGPPRRSPDPEEVLLYPVLQCRTELLPRPGHHRKGPDDLLRSFSERRSVRHDPVLGKGEIIGESPLCIEEMRYPALSTCFGVSVGGAEQIEGARYDLVDDRRLHIKIPHEPLRREILRRHLEVEQFRNAVMEFEREDVISPPAQKVKAESHLQQEIVSLLDLPEVFRGEYLLELVEMSDPHLHARKPDNRMDVPQRPPPLLYVRFEHEDGVGDLPVPLVHLPQLL